MGSSPSGQARPTFSLKVFDQMDSTATRAWIPLKDWVSPSLLIWSIARSSTYEMKSEGEVVYEVIQREVSMESFSYRPV